MKTFDRMVLLAWLLNAYDALITVFATQRFGAMELNPLMSLCLATGVAVFLLVKLGVMTVVCLMLRKRAKKGRKPWAILAGILVAFSTVSVWNTYLVIKMAAG